jgi:hypothetical protein
MSAIAQKMKVSQKMTEKLEQEVDEIPARDLPGGIRNIDTSIGINFDKAQIIMGEPTQITQGTKRVPELIRSLKSKGIEFIDADATEEEIPELPSGDEEKRRLGAGRRVGP